MAFPLGENATPRAVKVGNDAGLEYLVPNPDPDHGYAEMKGEVVCATAMSFPLGENATPLPVLVGNVAGLEYLVPNPDPDHGYAETNGELL